MRLRLLIVPLLALGCTKEPRGEQVTGASSVANPSDTTDDGGDDDESDVAVSTSDGADDTSTGGEGPKLDVAAADTGGPLPEFSEVFGHSGDVLYRMDPDTKAVQMVGTFAGCTQSIIDIALDADSRMFGAGFDSLWSIDRGTGECTLIANGDYPTSLSFVPAGTVDPDEEALVGFVDDEYIRIDTETGEQTSLGFLGDGLASSGDLVSVNNGGSWLTVDGPGCDPVDCIVEIDPSDGTILQNYGALPYDRVFGLAFWAGRAYGFSDAGELFEIQFGDTNVSTTLIEIPEAPGDLSFFGAGSTTSAPPAEG